MIKNLYIILSLLITGCSVSAPPENKKIAQAYIADKFKEGDAKWNHAQPNGSFDQGQWWKIFNDSELNSLQEKLIINNQNIVAAEKTYESSLALVSKARAAFLPTIDATSTISKQRSLTNNKYTTSSSHNLNLNTSWEVDLWGLVRNSVTYSQAGSEASKATLFAAKISAQSSLAQYYFELQMADKDQELLDKIVTYNKELLTYIKHRVNAGIAQESDLLNAQNALQSATAAAANNVTLRSQYEHAIAVLIGHSPSLFQMDKKQKFEYPQISVPASLPSTLLERRPDVVQAEWLMKQANSQIGIDKAAFFPNINLVSTLTRGGSGLGNLLSMPQLIWSVGPQLALTLFDGGANIAQLKSSKATYEASIASYKQIILSSFAEVEDNLVSLTNLDKQLSLQKQNLHNSKKAATIAINQHQAGTIDYAQVLNAKINLTSAEKEVNDLTGLKLSTQITLIKALGGIWNDR